MYIGLAIIDTFPSIYSYCHIPSWPTSAWAPSPWGIRGRVGRRRHSRTRRVAGCDSTRPPCWRGSRSCWPEEGRDTRRGRRKGLPLASGSPGHKSWWPLPLPPLPPHKTPPPPRRNSRTASSSCSRPLWVDPRPCTRLPVAGPDSRKGRRTGLSPVSWSRSHSPSVSPFSGRPSPLAWGV